MLSAFYRFITASLCLLAAIVLRAEITSPESSAPELPPYVLVVNDGHDVKTHHLPDSVFYRVAGHTTFKVNSTKLNLKDPFLHQLIDSVLPYANSEEWMLVGIDLRGAASPEGPYANNQRLARGRSRALIDFMSQRLDSVLITDAQQTLVAEDYPYLLLLMQEHSDPDAPAVESIIQRHTLSSPAAIKRDLRAYDHGRLWPRILRDYFPTLRSARVVLYFRRIYPQRLTAQQQEPGEVQLHVPLSDLPAPVPLDLQLPASSRERQHMLAVSSNLLYDAFYMPNFGWAPMPNVQLEWFPRSGRYTFLLGFLSPYYTRHAKHKFFQIRDYHLEARRYFSPGTRHLGTYLGAYVNNNIYGIGFSATKGWEGEGFGAALKLGHVISLGRRWRMDFHIAAGYYYTRYDPYVYGNPITGDVNGDYYYDYTGLKKDFNRRNHRFTWWGPTELGVTLSYDLIFYKHNQSIR